MFNQTHILLISYTQNNEIILNGLLEFIMFLTRHAMACGWRVPGFLLLLLSANVCMLACVCPPPRLLITGGMIWCDMAFIWQL